MPWQLPCALVELALYLVLVAAAVHLLRAAAWALRVGPLSLPAAARPPADAPLVTVQLPIRNEHDMIHELLDSVAALDWPRDRLEIQVLDDSDDETSAMIDGRVLALAQGGLPIATLRRADRHGYKAGNLAHGLSHARGAFVLVLDSDFRPPPDLLAALHAPFVDDATLAFTQARWSYRNREHGALTRLQAAILDALFTIEQARLSTRGAPVQFNGTAGMWRRDAIDRAGGWLASETALTEDLDLSLRAQELGLVGRTLPELVVSTELPRDMATFAAQQARWVRGGGLALRALSQRSMSRLRDAPTILAHLARHARQPLFVLAILRLALVAWGLATPVTPVWLGPLVAGFAIFAGAMYLGAGQLRVGAGFVRGALLGPALVELSIGLAPRLSLAFLGGVLGRSGAGFQRTPKGGAKIEARRDRAALLLDAVLAMTTIAAAIGFVPHRDVVGILTAILVLRALAFVRTGR